MSDEIKQTPGCAFIIGGTGGLGRSICQALAAEWDSVFFTWRSNREAAAELLQSLQEQTRAGCAPLDLGDEQSIIDAMELAEQTFGGIDALVFASGVAIEQPFIVDISEAQWAEVLATELIGFTRVVRAIIPRFRARGGGSLVSVVTFATHFFPPGDALSAVPKAGVEMLCRALAKEEGRYGIRANSVAPGIINAGLGSVFQQELYSDEIWEGQRKRVPLKRFGEGREIADCVAFLASGKSSYVTGQTLVVDGGMML